MAKRKEISVSNMLLQLKRHSNGPRAEQVQRLREKIIRAWRDFQDTDKSLRMMRGHIGDYYDDPYDQMIALARMERHRRGTHKELRRAMGAAKSFPHKAAKPRKHKRTRKWPRTKFRRYMQAVVFAAGLAAAQEAPSIKTEPQVITPPEQYAVVWVMPYFREAPYLAPLAFSGL